MALTGGQPDAGSSRSPGPSVQEILDGDGRPAPAVLREVADAYLGSVDVPVERYVSAAWHDLEVERLWNRVWQVACREEELAEVGDTTVYDIAGSSLVLVRSDATTVKAFHNACLHRGTALRVDGGRVGALRCPFHGWTWRLDGSLKTIPCDWDFPHADPARLALPEAKVATWGGWVFVNLDPGAEPLDAFLGGFPAHFPWRQDRMWKQAHVAKVLPCNWKVAQEAFIESYHVIATHPQLLLTLGDANTQYDVYPGETRWSRMITAQGVASPHLGAVTEQRVMDAVTELFVGKGVSVPLPEGTTARQMMADLMRAPIASLAGDGVAVSDAEVVDAIEYNVFPNFVPWGGYARLNYRFRPYDDRPDRSVMDVMLLGLYDGSGPRPAPAPVHHLGLDDPWTEARDELGPLADIFEQDTSNLGRVQRGLRATRKPGITLGNYQEIRIRQFHQELDRWVLARG